jgi:hypothetical protein
MLDELGELELTGVVRELTETLDDVEGEGEGEEPVGRDDSDEASS